MDCPACVIQEHFGHRPKELTMASDNELVVDLRWCGAVQKLCQSREFTAHEAMAPIF